MATMYDRLGELLNETLENGEIKYIRIDEKGGRRPVDPDILQTRQRQHVQVSRNTRIRRIIVTQRHKILA